MLLSRSFVPRTVTGLLGAVAVAALAAGCTSTSSNTAAPVVTVTRTASSPASSSSASSSSAAASSSSKVASPSSSAKAKPGKPVHIKLFNLDGEEYGVGMPVIAFFDHKIKDAKALQDATTVTVNGKKEQGAWYFEYSDNQKGYPIEAHFRLKNYWPAHSQVHVNIPVKGLSAGGGYSFDDSLTSDFTIGSRDIAVVNNTIHQMTVTVDGELEGKYRVSLGAKKTPTFLGTKIIMEKDKSICMHDEQNTYDDCGVKYDMRLTYSGEYLHAAPWNHHLGLYNSSNGCTNLSTKDAKKLYGFLRVGDVVQYPDADGPDMSFGAGYGDWNVAWDQWLGGGLVSTTT